MEGGDSVVSSASKVDSARSAESSCKSHKEAERRRRQRINAHLSTLRSLLPNAAKTDKASLLAEVVRHVRELRKKAGDAAALRDSAAGPSWFCDVVGGGGGDGGDKLVKATVLCEDRPGLDRDLGRAVRAVRGRAVRAEITAVGDLTRTEVVVEFAGGGGGGGGGVEEDVFALKRVLRAVVENRWSGSVGLTQSKRARVSDPIHEESD